MFFFFVFRLSVDLQTCSCVVKIRK